MKIFTQLRRVSLLFVLMLLVSACGAAMEAPVESVANFGSAEADYAYEEAVGESRMAPEPTMIPGAPSEFADGSSVPLEDFLASAVAQAQDMRVIIYTGNVSLVVKDTQEAVDAITTIADAQSGFVAGSNVYQSGDVLRGSITIRVPADRYQDTLAQLRDLAVRVERENSSTQDVTEEFTDLQARKTNLEFTEQALQQLLEERQRVGSTSDILEVHRELTNIRGQIEQIEGRMRYLANQSALSTITIELIPDVLSQPISVAGWEPQGVAKEALQALVVALQGLINLLIWLIIFILPLLIIMLLPVVVLALIIRWWWKRHQAHKKPAKQTATTGKD